MLYLCTIAETKKDYAKVNLAGFISQWLPDCTARAGTTTISTQLNIGEQVLVVCDDTGLNNGYILASFPTNDNPTIDTQGYIVANKDNQISVQDEYLKLKADQNTILITNKGIKVDVTKDEGITLLNNNNQISLQDKSIELKTAKSTMLINEDAINVNASETQDINLSQGKNNQISINNNAIKLRFGQNILTISDKGISANCEISTTKDIKSNNISVTKHIHPHPYGNTGVAQ
ncbi:hypothetical protein [Francisella philomiragia]|uniref:hypothetical protein n=1 Tax=Francisella philomiragia TaxID=28110 RepID=UPI0022436E0F|nr:hypothetical protein [Francisella philomiragia]